MIKLSVLKKKIYLPKRTVETLRLTFLTLGVTSGGYSIATEVVFDQHLLDGPQLLQGLTGISLGKDNQVSVGIHNKTLDEYELFSVPGGVDLAPGARISATAPVSVVTDDNTQSMPVPETHKGLQFAIPHISGSHKYLLLTRENTANVIVQISDETSEISLVDGVVHTFDAGQANGFAGLVQADAPIFVVHVMSDLATRVARPIFPLEKELWGTRSQEIFVAAFEDATSVEVIASDGTRQTMNLSAGEISPISTGVSDGLGLGDAIKLMANKPISAVQHDDGNGVVSLSLQPRWNMRSTLGLATETQYVSVICAYPDTQVALVDANGQSVDSAMCSPVNDEQPGRVYFGHQGAGLNIAAGSSIEADKPVAAIIEPLSSHLEYTPVGVSKTVPVRPRFTNPVDVTEDNPLLSQVFSEPGTNIEFYVNDQLEDEEFADWYRGLAVGTLPFFDGENDVRIVAKREGLESEPLETVITYNNIRPREQSGRISEDTVWTPGNGEPYVVSGTLTVEEGSTLTVMPDAVVHFNRSAKLEVKGVLDIRGSEGRHVLMQSALEEDRVQSAWQGLDILDGGLAKIEFLKIHHARRAISFAEGDGYVRNSIISVNRDGIVISNSSPVITRNAIFENENGVVVLSHANPVINDGNEIKNNNYGIRVENYAGFSSGLFESSDFDEVTPYDMEAYFNYYDLPEPSEDVSGNPDPLIQENSIYDNQTYNLLSFGFYDAPQVHVKAINNWWGSTSPALMSPLIFDFTDWPQLSPIVDYAYFLDSTGGQPVDGNYLNGPLYENTSLIENTVYVVLGDLVVPQDVTLEATSGAELQFAYNFKLLVEGNISGVGQQDEEIRFYSTWSDGEDKGTWRGVQITENSSRAVFEYFHISDAELGLLYLGRSTNEREYRVAHSTFDSNHIAIGIAGNASPYINNNLFDNYNFAIRTTALVNARGDLFNVELNGNEVTAEAHNSLGLSTAVVDEYRNAGVSLNPLPTVTNNNFVGEGDNYHASYYIDSSNVRLNAKNNWWGDITILHMSDRIYDYTDQPRTSPVVDYSDYLDSPNGDPVLGNYLNGPFPVDIVLQTDTTYTALGNINVPLNVVVGMQANSWVDFRANFDFTVDGKLLAQGDIERPVRFFSSLQPAQAGLWKGLSLNLSSRESVLDYVVIEHADAGLLINGYTDAQVEYQGEPVLESWANVTRSLMRNNNVGVKVSGGAAPRIFNTTTIKNNTGFYLQGFFVPNLSPQPLINYSDLVGNEVGIMLVNYGVAVSESTVFLDFPILHPYGHEYDRSEKMVDARFDFWGEEGPSVGQNIILENTPEAAIDFSEALDDSENAAAVLNLSVDYPYFSPNGDGVQDVATLAVELSSSSPWEIQITNASGQNIRSFAGEDELISVQWDGHTDSGQVASNGVYGVNITTIENETSISESFTNVFNIDLTKPFAKISSPVNDSYIGASGIDFLGSISDQNLSGYTLERTEAPLPGMGWQMIAEDNALENLSSQSLGYWSFDQEQGAYLIRLTVYDLAGNSSTDDIVINLDREAPEALISSPQSDEAVTGDVQVIGSVSDDAIEGYNLEYRKTTLGVYKAISSGDQSVTDGVLGQWATLGSESEMPLENGYYQLRLYVQDKTGREANNTVTVRVAHDLLAPPMLSVATFDPTATSLSVATNLQQAVPHGVDVKLVVKRDGVQASIVREVAQNATDTSPFNITWDGRDDSGALVSEGSFELTIEARIKGVLINSYVLPQKINVSYGVLEHIELLKESHNPLNQSDPIFQYVLGRDSHIVINIYEERTYQSNNSSTDGLTPIRSISATHAGSGSFSALWDGKSNTGELVSDGNYIALIQAFVQDSQNGQNNLVGRAVYAPLNIEYGLLTNVRVDKHVLDLTNQGENVIIEYDLGGHADVRILIIREGNFFTNTGEPENARPDKEFSVTHASGGSYSVVWDGFADNGIQSAEGAYRVVILASRNGLLLDRYDYSGFGTRLPAPALSQQNNRFSADRNEPYWITLSEYHKDVMTHLEITNNGDMFVLPAQLAIAGELNTLIWNGINPNTGKTSYGRSTIWAKYHEFAENQLLIAGGAPSVSYQGNRVNVISDPYLIYASYGQFTRFRYELNEDSNVTIKILPPGVSDPYSESAILVLDNASQGVGEHEVEWTGVVEDDVHQVSRQIGKEGLYTFVILTESASGASQTNRGLLNVRH